MDQLDWSEFEQTFARMEADARQVIAATGLNAESARVERRADVRYVGQAFEIVVDLPPGPYDSHSATSLQGAFEKAYLAQFTRTPPAGPVEIINVRIAASADASVAATNASNAATDTPKLKGERPVWSPAEKAYRTTPVYDRYALRPGDAFDGPALVEERESTLAAPERSRFIVAAGGEIVIDLD